MPRMFWVICCLLVNSPAFASPPAHSTRWHTNFYDVSWEQEVVDTPSVGLLWMAPFYSGGGYSSEARDFVLGLDAIGVRVSIEQHGDSFNNHFMRTMPPPELQALSRMRHQRPGGRTVAVCHSEAGAWHPALYSTSRCPPAGAAYTVGRTMFETDRLPSGWSDRLNRMDEVWVPTAFHADIFARGGVSASKIVVVPEAVDTSFFQPAVAQTGVAAAAARYNIDITTPSFRFFSVFKWERRKGWDVLLTAYLRAFSDDDAVNLYILTSSYHSSSDFRHDVDAFVSKQLLEVASKTRLLASIHLIQGVSQQDLPAVYAAMHAFVLPSRGEGWGRPHCEAMAMGLPVIATNWSGPVAFMTPSNSYPLRYDGLKPIPDGAFAGHLQAEPSVSHLQELLLHVWHHPEEAAAKGAHAREDMHAVYTPTRLARFVQHQIARIEALMAERNEL